MDFDAHIKKIADAQRLALSDEETHRFAKQLNDVLNAFDALDGIDTNDVKPSYHPIALEPRLRADEPKTPSHPTQNHQRTEKSYFKGPRMMR